MIMPQHWEEAYACMPAAMQARKRKTPAHFQLCFIFSICFMFEGAMFSNLNVHYTCCFKCHVWEREVRGRHTT